MESIKKSTEILLAVILFLMLVGSMVSGLAIEDLEKNITTDYIEVYREDLDRLLGKNWKVLGREKGYTATITDSINTYSWEIEYQNKEGEIHTALISNFKDHSEDHPLGYCIEKNFQALVGQKYAKDIVSAYIPAYCSNPEYWIRFCNYYVSGDHVTDRPYTNVRPKGNPIADVSMETYSIISDSKTSEDWENPETGLTLYDIDYNNVFRYKPDSWYLNIYVTLEPVETSEEEYKDKVKDLETTLENLIDALNEYTGHSVNVKISFTTYSDLEWAEPEYHKWYVIAGNIVEKTVSDTTYKGPDQMYYKLQSFYEE